jgi:phospholipase D-like protein
LKSGEILAEGAAFAGVMCIFALLFIAFEVMIIWFWIWTLMDCIKNENRDENTRITWIIVIALTGVIGALIYYLARRPDRMREEIMSYQQPVTAIEYDEEPGGQYQDQQQRYPGVSQNGFPICPQCGIELEFSNIPDVCPYCRINLT